MDAFRRSLDEIVRRHEVLRTTFRSIQGQPCQLIAPAQSLVLPLVDLAQLAAGEQASTVRGAVLAEVQRPLDLARGPLVRALLLRLGETEHVLVFTIHHIVSDAWSIGVLIREVMSLYEAFATGTPASLPELPIQYADFAVWQRQWLQGEALDVQLVYWKQRLSANTPVLELPIDRPRPKLPTFRGAHRSFVLPTALSSELKTLSRREDVTLFMALLAAFELLLQRYSRQNDIVVGVPIANRNRSEIEPLIGFFVNMLILRTDVSSDATFRTLLGQVRQTTIDAYAHQDVPFEIIVEALQPKRDTSHTPFFQVVFSLDNTPLAQLELPGLRLSSINVDTDTTRFDLIVSFHDSAQGLVGGLQYSTDLFDAPTIDRLIAHYRTVLAGIVADPARPLWDAPLLTAGEQRQLLLEWNTTQVAYPHEQTIPQLFAAQLQQTPDTIAIVFDDQCLSYRELNQRANQLAHYLQMLGVGPELPVAICVERSSDLIIGLLGISKAGGAYMPLDPAHPMERLSFMLDDSQAAVLLTQSRLVDALPVHWGVIVCLDDEELIAQQPITDPVSRARAENLAYLMYTSGSTGGPKGIGIPHRAISRLVCNTNYVQLEPSDRVAQASNASFDAATFEIWGALLHGACLVGISREVMLAPRTFAAQLRERRISTLFLTTALFNQLARDIPNAFQSLRQVLFGGEAVDPHWVGEVLRHGPPQRLLHVYGPTESTTFATWHLVRSSAAPTIAIGRALANTLIYVLDQMLAPVPIGVAGELYIGGDGLAHGYLNRPDLTAERFVPNPFAEVSGAGYRVSGVGISDTRYPAPDTRLYKTGDLVRYRPNGDLEFLGRLDDQMKIRGFRIEPEEVAAVLVRHPAIQECVVLAREDASLASGHAERRLVAYLVAQPGQTLTVNELQRFLKQYLPDYMVPATFMPLDQMPLTANGKIDRRALPDPDHARLALEESFVAPRTPIEERLAAIWARVLHLDRVGVYDNFFALGGDSIRSIQVMSQAEEYDLHFTLQQLFQYQTVHDLAEALDTAAITPAASRARDPFGMLTDEDRRRIPDGVEAAYPLTKLQLGMLFHSQYSPSSMTYHDIFSHHLRAPLDKQALVTALEQLTARHAILRTSFDLDSFSEPLQLVHRIVALPLDIRHFYGLDSAEQARRLDAWFEAEKRSPLDWHNPPLLRIVAYQFEAETFHLGLSFHHAILDGWSLASMLTELFQRYLLLMGMDIGPLPPAPPITFQDFVSLERDALESEDVRRYWIEKLSGYSFIRVPRWPSARPDIELRGYEQSVPIAAELSDRLKALAERASVPLKSVLLAAHLRVMSLLNGQPDVLTGLVSNGRPEVAGGEQVLGLFLNTLPFRLRLPGGSWLDLVRETFAAEQALLPFRWYPMAMLQHQLGGQPLFETAFNFIHFHVYQGVLDFKAVQVIGSRSAQASNFTLAANFGLDVVSSNILLRLEYDAAAICAEQIAAIGGYYANTLAIMVGTPGGSYAAWSPLPEAERQQLLAWGAPTTDQPGAACIHRLFEAQAERTPDAVAVLFDETKDERRTTKAEGSDSSFVVRPSSIVQLTYDELNRRANQLAHHLRSLGVRPEVRVGLCIERSLELVVGLLGVLKSGGAYVPLDPTYPAERLAFMLDDAQVRVLIRALTPAAAAAPPLPRTGEGAGGEGQRRIVNLHADWPLIAQQRIDNPTSTARADNLAYLIYTSGSTGQPKAVQVEHQQLVHTLVSSQREFSFQPTDVMPWLASVAFDIALFELFGPLLAGGRAVVLSIAAILDLPRLIDTLAECTALHGVPSLLQQLVVAIQAQKRSASTFASVRLVCVGGDRVPPALLAELQTAFPAAELCVLYGPTESTIICTRYWVPRGQPSDRQLLGTPLPNVQLRLCDAFGQLLPIGVSGEIYLGGAGMARGYLGRPDLTAERFVPDPFAEVSGIGYRVSEDKLPDTRYPTPETRLYKTGDRARYLPDGTLEFLGRVDQQVKLRGFRIELEEIAAVLGRHPAVGQCVVVAREDGSGDQRLVAYVVPVQGSGFRVQGSGDPAPESPTPDPRPLIPELRAFLSEKLPAYMIPSAFVVLDALPLTPNGKVDRRALPALNAERPAFEEHFVAPRAPDEALLAQIWAEVLHVERVGINDSFFALGGHSLLATQVISRIRNAFQIELPISALFEAATIANLTERITLARQSSAGPPAPPIVRTARTLAAPPLSFAQERLWFLDQLRPNSSAYNLSAAVRLTGRLDIVALQRSLAEVVQRHASLRTTFTIRNGQPVQVIDDAARVRLPLFDFTMLPTHAREAELRHCASAEAQQPFDLAQGPLLRVALLRLDAAEHVLFLTMHHIVADAWSTGILVGELAALYRACAAGQPLALPEPPIQYADYAIWQREWLQGTVLAAQLSYWRRQLADLDILQLPTDHPRPAVQTFRGTARPVQLSFELTKQLNTLNRQSGTTLYMTLLAAFATLLARYSGQDDIPIGSSFANRTRRELEPLIGFFVNTLVLRSDLAGDPTFRDLLARVQRTVLDAFAHQDLPFEQLVGDLQPARTLSHNPLFQVFFALQNAPISHLELPELTLHPVAIETTTAQFDLLLSLHEGANGLDGALVYSTDLFEAATIDRILMHFQTLLAGVVADPAQRIANLPLLTVAERQQLLVDWNASEAAYPQDACLHQLFAAQAADSPDAIALVSAGAHLTYWALDSHANQLAHELRGLGVGPEVRVALCLERSIALVIGILGVLKAGGAYVPLEPSYPAARLGFMLEDSQAPILLTQARLVDELPAHWGPVVCLDSDWDAIAQQPQAPPDSGVCVENLAYVIYTSGSTGQPKGVMIPHRGVVNYLCWCIQAYQVATGRGAPVHSSISFDLTITSLFAPLLVGQRVELLPEDVSGAALGAALVREGAFSLVKLTPTHLDLLAQQLPRAAAAGRTQALIIGGEAIRGESLSFWRTYAPTTRLINEYGPTETVVGCCVYEVPAGALPAGALLIGRPIANTQLYILDIQAQPLPIGVAGDLYVGGLGLAHGYLNRPDLTAERFVPNPFAEVSGAGYRVLGADSSDTRYPAPGTQLYKTGDRACYLPDGTIRFLGRTDRQIKIRGYRVEPGEIEAVLGAHPAVQECAVLAREDAPGDARLVAYVVTANDDRPPTIDDGAHAIRSPIVHRPSSIVQELRDHLEQTLPAYMVPAAFVELAALPVTPNGKLDRQALPAPDQTRSTLATTYVAPRTEAEALLAQIWSRVLDVAEVGVHDHFFELGGHSLLATQVVSRVHEAFGIDLPLGNVFETPTLAGLAERIVAAQRALPGDPVSLLSHGRPGKETPLSFEQQRLWFLDQLQPGTSVYNTAFVLQLDGKLASAALRASLNEIVQRQESLRTTFSAVAGDPRQIIAPASPLTLRVLDLTSLAPAARAAEAQRWLDAEARQPFDISRGPLLRLLLVRLDATEHALLVAMHHIIADAWSLKVFVQELAALYSAAGQPSALPALPISYADYTVWQREWLHGERLDALLSYWKHQLRGRLPVLDLPTDHPRPPSFTFRGATLRRAAPDTLAGELKTFNRQAEVTLFMTLFAAFQTLLYRYTGQTDILVGTPTANRSRSEIEGVIGLFVDTLVLRTDLSRKPTFLELLRRVREMTLDAFAHQNLPFEQLVETLQPDRDMSRMPLFQVVFALNSALPTLELSDLALRPIPLDIGMVQFDLSLIVEETAHGLVIGAEYSTDLFEAATIARLLAHFQTLLEGIVARPDQQIADLPLLMEAEQRQLLAWNAVDVPYPQDVCLHQLFEAQVQRTPEAIALVFDFRDKETRRQGDQETTGRTTNDGSVFSLQRSAFSVRHLTYRELNRRANQLARHLRDLGVGPEVRVGLYLERSLEQIVGLLGILKAGGAYVPFDASQPVARLELMFADAQTPVLVTQQSLLERLPLQTATCVCLDSDWGSIARSGTENPIGDVTPSNLAYLIYTSGSTGRPKAVMVEHRQIVNTLCAAQMCYALRPGERMLGLASLSFDIALFECFSPLLLGGTSILLSHDQLLDLPALVALLSQITFLHMLPSLMQQVIYVLQELGHPQPARWLHGILVGGDVIPSELVEQLRATLPAAQLYLGYGPTEGTIMTTCYPVPSTHPVSGTLIGKPLPNMRVRLYDARQHLVPIGVAGEIYIGQAGVTRGYLNRPDLTAERFVPDPFAEVSGAGYQVSGAEPSDTRYPTPDTRLYKTGDLARYLPDGNLMFLGRADEQVKVRGYRIEIGEIETVLGDHPAVRECAIIVQADAPGENRLVAYVVAQPDYVDEAEPDTAAEQRAEHVARWQMLYDQVYHSTAPQIDPIFNIVGWNSSYTGQPIPAAEMREWLEQTVARVLAVAPRRVLEIGCGSGLLLFRIAPHCDAYWGTDFSQAALDYLQRQLATPESALPQVKLLRRMADDFAEIPEQSFDTIILNSVVQYFPSIDYLVCVLKRAVQALQPGGRIIVGDLRSLPLLEAFHAGVQLHQAPAALRKAELRQQVSWHVFREQELAVDPAFFAALRQHVPQISHVEIQLKRGRHHNELTRFRYDVTLHVAVEVAKAPNTRRLDWQAQDLSVAAIRQLLVESEPERLWLNGVPNARILAELDILAWLADDAGPQTVGEQREALQRRSYAAAVDPEELWALGDELPYDVEIVWSAADGPACYSAMFSRRTAGHPALVVHPWGDSSALAGRPKWSAYANDPLRAANAQRLAPQLSHFLAAQLPAYMLPAAFVLLDALPLTPNGKIDRHALPALDESRPALDERYVGPRTAEEALLVTILADILRLERVGIHDDFFALGGHSLLATQVISRIREILQVELPLGSLFEAPTVAGMVPRLASAREASNRLEAPPIMPVSHADPLPLSFAQQRIWFLDKLMPSSSAYTMPVALRFLGQLDLAALQHMLDALVRRHEALRTTFPMIDSQPRQLIAPAGRVLLPLVDLAQLPSAERATAVDRLAREEAQRPFDLEQGPMLRTNLLRLDEAEHVLLFSLHHIVSDGWSLGVLIREVTTLYVAYASGTLPALPALPIQYADYAVWQRAWLQGPVLERQLAYWRTQLAELPALRLPTDRSRPALVTYRGTSRNFPLPKAVSDDLLVLSHREGTTMFMTLLAAWQLVLARYSGQDDVAVGTPIANRTRGEIEGLIGFFVNTLVLRGDLSGDPTFREFLGRVRTVCIGAYAHQDLPFEQVVDALDPPRDLSRHPLFQVFFSLQNTPGAALELPGLRVSALIVEPDTSKFDLSLSLIETSAGLGAGIEYNTDLFDEATILRLQGHLRTLLEGITAQPDQRVAALPLLTAVEQAQLRVAWNDTRRVYPRESCFHELFEARVRRTPDRVATACADHQLTYGELNRCANQLAGALAASGVGPDVVVALLAQRGLDFLLAVLALFKAGGAYLPLDPQHPITRQRQVLEQSGAALVLATQPFLPLLADIQATMPARLRVLSIEEILRQPQQATDLARPSRPEHLAYTIYTSGSTGVPKGAMVEQRGMLNHLYAKIIDLQLTENDCVAQTASQCFDISVWQYLAALLVGGQVRIFPDDVAHHPIHLLEQTEQQAVTILEVVPSLLRVMLDELIRPDGVQPTLTALRWLILTGEALPPDLCRRWLRQYPQVPLLNAYGPTECSDDVTHYRIDRPPAPDASRIAIGRPIANTQIYILDAFLQPLPLGVIGEIYVAGDGVGRGYLNNPLGTAEVFRPNPFAEMSGIGYRVLGAESSDTRYPTPDTRLYKTGDLARQLPDGRIDFLGRADQQVKIHGFRIELGEIEAALRAHPAVQEQVVLVRADAPGAHRLVAYVVPAETLNAERRTLNGPEWSSSSFSVQRSAFAGELRTFLQERLPIYMLPSAFVLLDALPLTPNGKLDRAALPAPEQADADAPDSYVAPRTGVEQQLAAIWAAILRLDRVSIHDNFFTLGGDSILSIQVVARANRVGLRLTPRQLFQNQTIAALATVVGSVSAIATEAELPTGPLPLTPIQQHFLVQDLPNPHHFNQALLFELRQPFDRALLTQAITQLLRHHDALRLRFRQTAAGWQQLNLPAEPHAIVAHCDLAALPAPAQRTTIEQAAAAVQTSLHLIKGPLVRVVLFDLVPPAAPPLPLAGDKRSAEGGLAGGEGQRLLIVVHHLAIDGVSWRILLEDLQTAYVQLASGATVRLPAKTTSFGRWAEQLADYAQSAELRHELDYWLGRPWDAVAELPVDDPAAANTEDSTGVVAAALNAAETQALLHEIHDAYHTQINDLLLTALVQALAPWTGTPTLLIELEGHGREELFADVDLSRTVGWFTTLFPVLLDLRSHDEPAAALKAIKEQLRSLPQHGIGYGLLRYLSAEAQIVEQLRSLPRPALIFNYLGQLDQTLSDTTLFQIAAERSGPSQSPETPRPYLLAINAVVAAGQLQISWTYSAKHQRATIERLSEAYLARLRALIAHCRSPQAGGYTPSDFELVKLNQQALDKIVAKMQKGGRK